ncbi:MAG: gfo/Idh/MocA family oxidoreductase, partial [Cyclobacteriaceae bacterium]
MNRSQSRRSFIRKAASLSVLTSTIGHSAKSQILLPSENAWASKPVSANDHIQIAAIGMGIMGFNNVEHTLKVPGVKLVAACDLYSGRLERTREVYGREIAT